MIYLLLSNDIRFQDHTITDEEMNIIEVIFFIISLISTLVLYFSCLFDTWRRKRKSWFWGVLMFWPVAYIYVFYKFRTSFQAKTVANTGYKK